MRPIIAPDESDHSAKPHVEVALLMILLSISLVFLAVLFWMLLAPLKVSLDTQVPILSVRWKTIGCVQIGYVDGLIVIELRIIGIHRKWYPGKDRREKRTTRAARTAATPTGQQPVRKRRRLHLFPKLIRTLKTCRIDYVDWAIDTGDPIANAKLYPLNTLTRGRIHVNFVNDNRLRLQFSARPWRILAALCKPRTT